MTDSEKALNWGQIVTNAVSTLVAAVFIGAAVIVWNAATTMDTKIQSASGRLKSSQIELKGTQDILLREVSDLQAKITVLENRLSDLTQKLATASNNKTKPTLKPGKPAITPKPENNLTDKLRTDNLDRLKKDLRIYQMAE